MLNKVLLIANLSLLSACGSIPAPPRHVQYGAFPKVNPPGYYGVDSQTASRVYKSFTDPSMNGAQCLSPADYKAALAYIQKLTEIAADRCQ